MTINKIISDLKLSDWAKGTRLKDGIQTEFLNASHEGFVINATCSNDDVELQMIGIKNDSKYSIVFCGKWKDVKKSVLREIRKVTIVNILEK